MASLKSYISTCLSSFFNSKSDWIKGRAVVGTQYSYVEINGQSSFTVYAPINGYAMLMVWNVSCARIQNNTLDNLSMGNGWSKTWNDDFRWVIPVRKGDQLYCEYNNTEGTPIGRLGFYRLGS